MTGTVRIDVSDGVALLTLDRPAKLNAVTDEMSRELLGLSPRWMRTRPSGSPC